MKVHLKIPRTEIKIEEEATALHEKNEVPLVSKKIIPLLHPREKLARKLDKAFSQKKKEEFEADQAAAGGERKDISSRYLPELSYGKRINNDDF